MKYIINTIALMGTLIIGVCIFSFIIDLLVAGLYTIIKEPVASMGIIIGAAIVLWICYKLTNLDPKS